MSRRVALPVLMWSISAAGADESPADPPAIEIEGLTVTATKTERSTFEVPASVSIIGPERIESEEPQSIGDLLEELPNVEVISDPRRIGETANMRGFDEERTEVGLRFRTTDWLTTWGSYAEAFRAPGLTEAFTEDLHFRRIPGVFPDNFFVPNPDLKPETTSTLEAAMRTRFDDLLMESDRLRLEAAYSGARIDFGIDNLTDKAYRRHLSLIDKVGRNFRASVSYRS